MTDRFDWLYPFLLAVVPVLHLAASHPGQTSLDDLAVIIVVILAGCVLVYAGASAVGSQRRRLASLATLIAVMWFYGYAKVANNINEWLEGHYHYLIIPVGLVLTAVLCQALLRRPKQLDRVARFLTLVGVLLVAQFGVRIGAAQWRLRRELRDSKLISALAKPIGIRSGFAAKPRRDIYLIVLDEYANSSITQERFGFDNRKFQDNLRRLGFVVPRLVRSNYMHTTLSLPSMLNIAHLTDLTTEVGPYTADPAVPNYLVENNRTLAFLQSQGYRFIFFPSQWWLATRHNRHADLEFHAWTRISSRELSHSELRRNLRLLSVLDQLHDDLSDDFNHLTRTFEALSQVPQHDSDAPIFAFAHIMKPHHPFAFDRECRPRRRHVFHHAPATSADQGYVVQLKCLNRLVLQLVDSLLRTSAVSPVILIQGDHGTKTLGASTARSTEAISPAAARERFGAFGAYYLPDGGAAEFGDSVTVVNVLGNVLRYYFGADVPRQREALYMSVTKRPYDFQQVDPEWLTGGDALAPLSRASH